MRKALTLTMTTMLLGGGGWACGEDPVAPDDTTIVGTWFFIGFTDGDRVASTTGTWVFFDDGLMAVDVTITFPQQNTTPIARVGSYEVVHDTLTYELNGPLSSWIIDFDGSEVLLTQTAPDPADNTIRLRRVGSEPAVVSTSGPRR